MTLSLWPIAAQRAVDLADLLRVRAEAAGPPPALSVLPPRPRATYDRLLDAVNRLPRPLMVLGSLALLASALIAPDWFTARMEALSDMPEALWWIIGAVLSLHFGARYQDHAHSFQREITTSAPPPTRIQTASPDTDAALTIDTLAPAANPALEAWRSTQP